MTSSKSSSKPPVGPPPRFPQPRRGPAGAMPSPVASARLGPGVGYPPAALCRAAGEATPIYDEVASDFPGLEEALA